MSNVSKYEMENELPTQYAYQIPTKLDTFLLRFSRCIFKTGIRWVNKKFKETLYRVQLFYRDDYIKQAATKIEDTKLVTKLS